MLTWFKKLFGRKTQENVGIHPHNRIRIKMDTDSIKARILGLGWQIREIPVKKSSPDARERKILYYKVVALKGERSLEATGKTLDEAVGTIGAQLGVIPRN